MHIFCLSLRGVSPKVDDEAIRFIRVYGLLHSDKSELAMTALMIEGPIYQTKIDCFKKRKS